MKLIHRIGYYLGGLSIGLIFLFIFLNGKKVSCDYGPEARVIKNINSKPLGFSTEAKEQMFLQAIDSVQLKTFLKSGDVNFSESDTRAKPCGIYHIEGQVNDLPAMAKVKNCDSLVTVVSFSVE